MFLPSVGIFEIILRGTFVYLLLFILLRLIRRETGGLGIADVLVIVLIADASQNAMASEYKSVTEGGVLILTIIFWNVMLDWLGSRYPRMQRLVRPAALLLIQEGKMIRKNMRKEFITDEELMSQLRKRGVESVSEVKKCFMEGDGEISVIKKQ